MYVGSIVMSKLAYGPCTRNFMWVFENMTFLLETYSFPDEKHNMLIYTYVRIKGIIEFKPVLFRVM